MESKTSPVLHFRTASFPKGIAIFLARNLIGEWKKKIQRVEVKMSQHYITGSVINFVSVSKTRWVVVGARGCLWVQNGLWVQ